MKTNTTYRMLEVGEMLQKGDEYFPNWEKVKNLYPVDGNVWYRRPVASEETIDDVRAAWQKDHTEMKRRLDAAVAERMDIEKMWFLQRAELADAENQITDLQKKLEDERKWLRERDELAASLNFCQKSNRSMFTQIEDKDATIRRLKEKLESVEPFAPTVDGWAKLMAVIPPNNGISVAEGAVGYIQELERDLECLENYIEAESVVASWRKIQEVLPEPVEGSLVDRTIGYMHQLAAERDNWMETAAQYSRNQEFYHGLVTDIGNMFGLVARVADDGMICENVLALKVPELVAKLIIKSEENL